MQVDIREQRRNDRALRASPPPSRSFGPLQAPLPPTIFSDLRGFTRITDTEPEQVVSLLNDYSDVIVSTIQEHGGDVLKLIGDGTLAIFTA